MSALFELLNLPITLTFSFRSMSRRQYYPRYDSDSLANENPGVDFGVDARVAAAVEDTIGASESVMPDTTHRNYSCRIDHWQQWCRQKGFETRDQVTSGKALYFLLVWVLLIDPAEQKQSTPKKKRKKATTRQQDAASVKSQKRAATQQ